MAEMNERALIRAFKQQRAFLDKLMFDGEAVHRYISQNICMHFSYPEGSHNFHPHVANINKLPSSVSMKACEPDNCQAYADFLEFYQSLMLNKSFPRLKFEYTVYRAADLSSRIPNIDDGLVYTCPVSTTFEKVFAINWLEYDSPCCILEIVVPPDFPVFLMGLPWALVDAATKSMSTVQSSQQISGKSRKPRASPFAKYIPILGINTNQAEVTLPACVLYVFDAYVEDMTSDIKRAVNEYLPLLHPVIKKHMSHAEKRTNNNIRVLRATPMLLGEFERTDKKTLKMHL